MHKIRNNIQTDPNKEIKDLIFIVRERLKAAIETADNTKAKSEIEILEKLNKLLKPDEAISPPNTIEQAIERRNAIFAKLEKRLEKLNLSETNKSI